MSVSTKWEKESQSTIVILFYYYYFFGTRFFNHNTNHQNPGLLDRQENEA